MPSWNGLAVAMVIGTVATGSVRAEFFNDFCGKPTSTANTFVLVLQGNVIADLNLTASSTDPTVNPFAYVNQNYFGGTGTSDVTAALNSNGNTVVTYTGSNPILSSYNFQYTNGNGMPHFGLDGSGTASIPGGGPAFNIISQTWNFSSGSTSEPSLSVSNPNAPTSGKVDYISFYAAVTSGGQTVGEWFEVPYTPGTSPTLTLTNYTSSPETLSNVGYMFSPTLIPLDNLNFGDAPPPGTADSPFIPLPNLDGTSLTGGDGIGGAGGTITTSSLPEPSSIISMTAGLVLIAGYIARRGKTASRARSR